MNQNATMQADFRKGANAEFFASDGWTNGSCFNCGWYKENTSFNGGVLNLTIDKDHSGKYAYSGAEYRTNGYYKYGYYETSMQAIKNDGVGSSFFTYTGPSENNPWDEIDIEVTADGYLYNMVRILAGTLCEVGAGRMQPEQIPGILAGGDRSQAGPPLPAKGLFLKCVEYPDMKENHS